MDKQQIDKVEGDGDVRKVENPLLAEIKGEIAARFPRVPSIETEELRAAMLSTSDLLLLDVRKPIEFGVSHLRGARHAPTADPLPADLLALPRDRTIVTYCSVGYRSAAFAEKLIAAGFTDVRNYLGSIFEWANRGYPVVNQRGVTPYVHPYDRHWGQLLNKKYHPTE